MSEEPQATRLEEEQERILTLKINLEGPAELVSWVRQNTPPRFGAALAGLLPADFRRHMRASQREQLLAVRSLLDAMIQRLEERPPKKAVDVEVE